MIAVVPARGGSKGILRKNLRVLNGKPLLFYVLNNVTRVLDIDVVIVTSDDETIINYAKQFDKVIIRNRPKHLASDEITIDPVVSDAILWYENAYDIYVEDIITLQPTSPTLSNQTIQCAIKYYKDNNLDCLISAVDDTHLSWFFDHGNYKPMYEERVNRQWLHKRLKETGAFVICKRENLAKGSRLFGNTDLYELNNEEAIDIDTPVDWLICNALLNIMQIDFVVRGDKVVGFGHIRRALTLADYWLGHNIRFVCYDTSQELIDFIKGHNYDVKIADSFLDVIELIRDNAIVINDILDTEKEYILKLKNKRCFVISFEDLGGGAEYCDLTINALYEKSEASENQLYGYKYECLDERFIAAMPNQFNAVVRNILVTFGGADPSNLTIKTLAALSLIKSKYEIRIVIGPAYKNIDAIREYIDRNMVHHSVKVFTKVKNMAEIMKDIDFAITSNGRTVYELASMKVPIISMAQNDRETIHLFARYSKGVKYLGIGCLLDAKIIAKEITEVIFNQKIREEMFLNLPAEELRNGLSRVTQLIEYRYMRWKHENNGDWK